MSSNPNFSTKNESISVEHQSGYDHDSDVVYLRNVGSGLIKLKQCAPAVTDDGTAVVSAANICAGLIVCTPTADRGKAFDTAANIISALQLTANNMSFDFHIINLADDGTSFITMSAGTGITLSPAGSAGVVISAQDLAEDAFTSGTSHWRVRRTGAAAATIFRLS